MFLIRVRPLRVRRQWDRQPPVGDTLGQRLQLRVRIERGRLGLRLRPGRGHPFLPQRAEPLDLGRREPRQFVARQPVQDGWRELQPVRTAAVQLFADEIIGQRETVGPRVHLFGGDAIRLPGFCDAGNRIILTNGFAKKTPKTPRWEIALAAQRRRDYQNRKARR